MIRHFQDYFHILKHIIWTTNHKTCNSSLANLIAEFLYQYYYLLFCYFQQEWISKPTICIIVLQPMDMQFIRLDNIGNILCYKSNIPHIR